MFVEERLELIASGVERDRIETRVEKGETESGDAPEVPEVVISLLGARMVVEPDEEEMVREEADDEDEDEQEDDTRARLGALRGALEARAAVHAVRERRARFVTAVGLRLAARLRDEVHRDRDVAAANDDEWHDVEEDALDEHDDFGIIRAQFGGKGIADVDRLAGRDVHLPHEREVRSGTGEGHRHQPDGHH